MRKRIALVLMMLVGSLQSFAGTASGAVTEIEVSTIYPIIFFKLSGKLSDTPRCNESGRFVVDVSKPGGQNTADALWSAKNFSHQVEVFGLNTCRANWRAEDVKKITLR